MVEDIFLAFYLAILQPVLGDSNGLGDAALEFGQAFAFLPFPRPSPAEEARWVGKLVDASDDELLTVCFVGVAVLAAGVAEEFGVSDAIGAFMAGLILAEPPPTSGSSGWCSPCAARSRRLFFFAFGLTVDPSDVGSVALPVAVAAVVLSLVLNLAHGIITARMHGYSRGPHERRTCRAQPWRVRRPRDAGGRCRAR